MKGSITWSVSCTSLAQRKIPDRFSFLGKVIRLCCFFILFLATDVIAQVRKITGTILSDDNLKEPLIGASVMVKGTTKGGVTDFEGKFEMEIDESDPVTLVVRYMGYKEMEVSVGQQSELTISLPPTGGKTLDDVVVVGYGVVKKRDLTGAVTSLKSAELQKVPTQSVVESVQGKVPGMDITRSSGKAGAPINVTVRGNRSLKAGNGPLYIVDGIQYNNIEDINPADIQSMEVLKDASSTAIYGSRGANGVIIVTTKRGAEGKARIFFNTYAGASTVAGYPKVYDGNGYATLRREAYRTIGTWTGPADDSKIFNTTEMNNIKNGISTDFADALLGVGNQQDYQFGVSGGTDKLKSYLSLDYFKEQGLLKNDNLKRYSGRINLDYKLNDYIKVGTQTQITYYDQNARQGPLGLASKINPLTPIYDSAGKIIVYPNQGKDINPLIDEEPNTFTNNIATTRIFPTVYAEATPLPGLTLRTNASYNIAQAREGLYAASYSVMRNGGLSRSSYTSTTNKNLDWQGIVTYQKDIKDHSFTLTGLSEWIQNVTETATAQGEDQLLATSGFYNLGSNAKNVSIYSNYIRTDLVSFAGRLNYSYKGKYLLTFTARGDGASQTVGKVWDFFPSAAAGWRIVDEGFMKGQKLFNELKLRGSYGISGNASVAAYSSESNLIRIPYGYGDVSAPGFAFPTNMANPGLEWEKTANANLGLDFGLWNSRLMGSIDVYNSKTNQLLLDRALPATTGFTVVTDNVGKTRNRGIELALTGIVVDKPRFNFSTTLTFSSNKEEIVELIDGVDVLSTGANAFLVKGYPINSYYNNDKLGIWQLGQEEEAAKYGQVPGDIRVRDINGDGKIDNLNDRMVVGSQVPKWQGGLNLDFRIGDFDINMYWYARVGQTFNFTSPGTGTQYVYDPRGIENGMVADYWTPENPTDNFPRPNANLTYASLLYYNTIGYRDGTFLKLRNLSIGYRLPDGIGKKIGIQKARIYLTGKNLLTFSKVKDYDPERGGSLNDPMTRLFVGGLNLEF